LFHARGPAAVKDRYATDERSSSDDKTHFVDDSLATSLANVLNW